ncbi:hypothetical protein ACF5W4_09480 [Bacillota bacterium Lsc_1132]
MKRLNKNSMPFIFLFVFHTALLCYSFYKTRKKKRLLVLLMSNIGLSYIFEYVVLNVLHAYKYKPKVFKLRKLDNIFGAILSQAIFVPFTAIFVTSNQLGWKVKWIFSFYFAAIETLFVKLDVYRHNWWRTIYSFLIFPFYFQLSDSWDHQLQKGQPVVKFLSLNFTTFVFDTNLLFFLTAFRKFQFGRGRFRSWDEHFVIVPLYTFLLSFISTCIFSRQNTWSSWLYMFMISIGFDKVLIKLKIVKSKLRRQFIASALKNVITIFIAALFRKWIYEQEE